MKYTYQNIGTAIIDFSLTDEDDTFTQYKFTSYLFYAVLNAFHHKI